MSLQEVVAQLPGGPKLRILDVLYDGFDQVLYRVRPARRQRDESPPTFLIEIAHPNPLAGPHPMEQGEYGQFGGALETLRVIFSVSKRNAEAMFDESLEQWRWDRQEDDGLLVDALDRGRGDDEPKYMRVYADPGTEVELERAEFPVLVAQDASRQLRPLFQHMARRGSGRRHVVVTHAVRFFSKPVQTLDDRTRTALTHYEYRVWIPTTRVRRDVNMRQEFYQWFGVHLFPALSDAAMLTMVGQGVPKQLVAGILQMASRGTRGTGEGGVEFEPALFQVQGAQRAAENRPFRAVKERPMRPEELPTPENSDGDDDEEMYDVDEDDEYRQVD
jgi:hypothetical protein